MDLSQLPDISGQLVTPDYPPRDDLEGMDYERCAALHNYLVHYAWLADGRPLATLNNNSSTFFTTYGAEAEALRPRLHPSLVSFLDIAIEPPNNDPDGPPPPFFIFASQISTPELLFEEFIADLKDQPVDSLVRLYCVGGLCAEGSNGGVLYHQRFHRAAVFMHLDAYEGQFPVDDHPELWHPLESVLSNWIGLIHLGKVVAGEEPALFDFEKFGPWEWRPYSEAQVTSCVSAFDRLCKAIKARMPISPITTATMEQSEQLVPSAVLDSASVPNPCFVYSFLTRARRPPFKYIAPGILIPPADSARFIAAQPFSKWPCSQHSIPPVCLFPADTGAQDLVNLRSTTDPFFCAAFYETPPESYIPSRLPAGLYSNPVDRDWYDDAGEEGFWLLLPFTFNNHNDKSKGARKSDGHHIDRESVSDLFQHGFKPFGGDYYRPQRLERLFDCWLKLVELGIWSVGPEGVEGSIDTFRDADLLHWKDYYISPTW